jgi:glycoside/pentoside/hexuronide:cation symporter, GPH family
MKLPLSEKIGFGLGDLASNLVFATVTTFLMFFYTDIYGLSAAVVGTLLFVARALDAIWDLYLGTLIDRTHTRFGQCRPYLIFAAPLLAIAAVATFTVPDLTPHGKLLYAYVSYCALMICYSLVNIPYSALPALMTDDARERTTLSGYRMFFAMIGTLAVGMLTLKLVAVLGAGDKQLGYQRTVVLMAVVGCCLFWACCALTRERVPPVVQALNVREDFQVLMRGRAWWMLTVMGLSLFTAFAITQSSVIYYFTYVVGSPTKLPLYLLGMGLGLLIGVVCSVALSRRFCKRRVMLVAAIASIGLHLGFYFVPPGVLPAVLGLGFVIALSSGIQIPILWSMVADIADDAEARSGRRMVGLTTASVAFSHKFGLGVGGGLAGLILASVGYVANQAQSPQALHGLVLIMSVVPAIGNVIEAVTVYFYPLGQRELDAMAPRLRAQRGESAAAA